MFMFRKFSNSLAATITAACFSLSAAGCASSSKKPDDASPAAKTGPLDGTWGETTLTCDGEPNPKIPQMTLNVADESGSFALAFGPSCVASIAETYAYGAGTLSITPTGVSCSPNDGCAEVFGGTDCLPGPPPPTEFTYALEGDSLTFTKVSGGPPADNCPEGAEEVYTMKRQ